MRMVLFIVLSIWGWGNPQSIQAISSVENNNPILTIPRHETLYKMPLLDAPIQISPSDGASLENDPIVFRWQKDGASRYWLWIGDNNNNTILNIENIEAAVSCLGNICSYPVQGLAPGTYAWSVLSGNNTGWNVGANGFFLWSDSFTFSLGKTISPIKPSGLTVFDTVEDWGVFEWQANPNFDLYAVYITKPDNKAPHFGWYSAVDDDDTLTCGNLICSLDLHLQLTFNGDYTWYIMGWNDINEEGVWSVGIPFSVAIPPPAVPENIAASNTETTPTLTWANDKRAAYYQIYVGTDDFSQRLIFNWWQGSQLCHDNICALPLDNPEPGNYVIYLQAWGPGGFNLEDPNAWSDPGVFTIGYRLSQTAEPAPSTTELKSRTPLGVAIPPPAVPENIAVSNTETLPTLTWANDKRAAYYQIYVGTDDFSQRLIFNWWQGSQLCHDNICALPLDNPEPGNYVVYLQAWGPGGFNLEDPNAWSDPRIFTIDHKLRTTP